MERGGISFPSCCVGFLGALAGLPAHQLCWKQGGEPGAQVEFWSLLCLACLLRQFRLSVCVCVGGFVMGAVQVLKSGPHRGYPPSHLLRTPSCHPPLIPHTWGVPWLRIGPSSKPCKQKSLLKAGRRLVLDRSNQKVLGLDPKEDQLTAKARSLANAKR